MNRCTADCCSFQFYRFKDGHWIDKAGSGRTPLDLLQMSFPQLILPFECIGISWKFCRPSQGASIGNVIIGCHQSI